MKVTQILSKTLLVLLLGTVPFWIYVTVQAEANSASSSKLLKEIWTSKEADEEPIAILFTGDIMLGRYIATLRGRNGGDFPFTYMPEVIESTKTALAVDELDLVVANLEGPIVEKQIAWGDMVFRFAPETADLLKKVGFTTVSLANNHSINQGRAGLDETRMWLSKAGVDSFGHPDTSTGDWSFLKYDFPAGTVGFLGLDDVDFKVDMPSTLARIKELNTQVDFLIIGVHWGLEYEPVARPGIQEMAHQFVDAGADFIWGHHPHVVQNHEIYKDAIIYYSLGNFVFDQYWSQETQKGLVLGLLLDRENSRSPFTMTVKEIPVQLVNMGEPRPMAEPTGL